MSLDKNLLIKGDKLKALNYLLQEKSLKGRIDLVYIDPPFATGNSFTVSEGRNATISNVKNGEVAYTDKLFGKEFIDFLRQRLVLIRELMSDRGSIYLHIDYKIGHYVKVMMDKVFGVENFINDITRIKCNPKNFKRTGYGNIKDLILFYSKTSRPIWNEPKQPYTEKDLEKLFPKIDENGRRYTTVPLHAPGETQNGESGKVFQGIKPPAGRHWRQGVEVLKKWNEAGIIEWSGKGNPRKKIFADEQYGKRMQDVWEFKDPPYPNYPTEKNPDLLDLIMRTSSNPESIVLDCFCGSGTTLKSAGNNGRQWIGVDQSEQAIKESRKKLDLVNNDLFNPDRGYDFIDMDDMREEEREHQLPCPGTSSNSKYNSASVACSALRED